ncbi:helix-turn-helix domain-containing protein [Arthrobacter zhaoguopingii]|uniref:helix-turn-helix domain-containing protein n=1 Tax=Arthrobacter zhaoguopingii TaxID=2681491 RepID=UPI00135AA11C|nr:hypothetical protein [Arthrobacter zhaoguopingii]
MILDTSFLIVTVVRMAGKETELGETGKTVAENVRRLRGNVSFAEISRWLSDVGRPIPPLGLRRIEAGERRVDVDELMAFAGIFGVNASALLLPPDDSEREYRPTGQKFAAPLSQIWDWSDGDGPYLPHTERESLIRYALRARPPGRQTVLSQNLDELHHELKTLAADVGALKQWISAQTPTKPIGQDPRRGDD